MALVYLLISAMPLVRDPLWEHFMSDMTAIKFLGLACLLYAAWHCLLRRQAPGFTGSSVALLMAVLCGWAALSWFTLGAPIAWDKSPLLSYACFLMLLAVTVSVVDTWRRLEHVLWAIVLAVSIASLYIVREWQEYHNIYAQFRPGWVTGDPNYFTASALVGLPLALVFCGRHFAGWKRCLAAGCALLTLVATGLAASRGGMLGLAAMVGWLAWKKHHLGALVLLLTLAAPPLLLWSRSPLNRLVHPDASDVKSSDTRLALWQAGLNMVEQHPVRGIGLGEFKAEVERYAAGHKDLDHIAHNTYLALAAEMGLPALLLYLAMLASAWLALGRLQHGRGAPAPRDPPDARTVSGPGSPQPVPVRTAVFRGEQAPTVFAGGFAPDASRCSAPLWPLRDRPSETTGWSLSPAPEATGADRGRPLWLADAALGMQAAILGFSVSAFFLSAQYTKLFWLLLAVAAAGASLSARAAAEEDGVPKARFATRAWEPAAHA